MQMLSLRSAFKRAWSVVASDFWLTRCITGVVGAIGLGLATPSLAQTVVTLTPIADSYTQRSTPTTNYGSATTMLVRIDAANTLTRAGYLEFDLSSLPAGNISSAQLRVYGSHDPGGTGVTIAAYPGAAATAWSEAALNWNNATAQVAVDFNGPPLATASVSPTAAYHTWNVTSLISSRRNVGNATVALYPTAADTYRVTFNSKEATANKPQLVVTIDAPPGNGQLAGSCPTGYVVRPGLNANFPSNGVNRAFVLNLPTNISTPRPVWVPLTSTVESTNEILGTRGGNAAMTSEGFIVIGPVRRCSGQSPDIGDSSAGGGACNAAGSNGWTWNAWNESRVFAAAGDPWKTNEGDDSRFLEAVVRCVAASYPVDARRMFVGGLSSGGAMANRALAFNSDFWAGGEPISGDWHVTQDDGNAFTGQSNEVESSRKAVQLNPTKIFQGRTGPYPLYNTLGNTTQLAPMVVITLWGGANDNVPCVYGQPTPLCYDGRSATQASANYFSAQPNVVHVACSSHHGFQWPTFQRDAWNRWVLRTLASHPKGTPKSSFVLPPLGSLASDYNCVVGSYADHYPPTSSMTLSPIADTYTQQNTATTNYGAATTILVRQDSANALTRHGYFEFDLSSVPTGTVISAQLQLFGSQDQGGAGTTIKAIGSPGIGAWSETALNYNTAPSLTGVDLSDPGVSTVTVAPPPATTYNWDITSYINARKRDGFNNATVVLAYPAADTYRSTFNSKEASANRPQLAVTVAAAPPPPVPLPQNWSMFGHDYSNTRSSTEITIQSNNVYSLHPVWRSGSTNGGNDGAVGGVAGTPAIVDGFAYVSDFNGWVRAIYTSNGAELWKRQLTPTGSTLRQLAPSVAVTADTVYAAGNGGMVYALNRSDGTLKWATQIETTPNARINSSPVVFDNKVIIGSGSFQVLASATPTFRGSVKFLDATTGALLPYSVNVCPAVTCGGGVNVWSSAAIDPATRTGFIGTGQAYFFPAGPYSDALVAFDIDTGAIKWAKQFETNDVFRLSTYGANKDHDVGAAPNLFTADIPNVGVRDIVGVGSKSGYYDAYDRVTGERYWRFDFGARSSLGGVMHATAYMDNGVIYAISNENVGGNSFNSQIPRPGKLYAINASNGVPYWNLPLTEGGFGGISVAMDMVLFTTWDGMLHIVESTLGTEIKTIQIGNAPGAYVQSGSLDGFPNGSASGPVVANGRIFVGYGWTWGLNIPGGLAAFGL